MKHRRATQTFAALLPSIFGMVGTFRLSAQQAAVSVPPASTSPAVAKSEEASIQLQFPNNAIGDLLGVYELLTEKAIVKETGIFDGKPISLVTSKPLTKAEAIELIESSLQLNGYVLTESADGVSIRITLPTLAQANITRGLSIHESPEALPKGHTMASYFLRLEHLDPSEAATTFWSHLGLNTFGRLTPVASPPGLLITENADNIRQILRVAAVLDVPQGQSHLRTEFYELKYADAVVIGQILTSTFTTRQALPTLTTDTAGDTETRIPARLVTSVPARVVADDRLNRIMLVALERDHEYARKLIAEFDQPLKDLVPLERRLKYVFVDQVLPVLVDVLQDVGTGSSTMAGGEVVRTKRPPQASTDPSTLAGRPRRAPVQREGVRTGPVGYEDELVPPEENAAPLSVLVGKTRLVADVQANKLIAYGPAEDLSKITSLLDHLDRKPPQVYLATIIGQLSLGDGFEFGVDYLRQFQGAGSGDFAGSFVTWDSLQKSLTDSRNPIPKAPLQPSQGLNIYGQIADGFDIYVRALESTQRFKVLSRPSIYAANNKKAVITSGRRIPVPTSSITDLANTTSVRTNITYQDVVLKLEVIPLINSNQEVSLTIAQINDTVSGEQRVGENIVPIIGTERLVTTVTVANRSTIVLGGLITENEEKSVAGIPVLSRIPVLGNAFKSTKTRKSRKELLIFIQPVVVEDNAQAAEASLSEDLRTRIGADAATLFPAALPTAVQPEPAAAMDRESKNPAADQRSDPAAELLPPAPPALIRPNRASR
ncbi:MAG: secretin N-terminal domain-containing protein [Verrucomicrobiales bacterium]